MSLVLFAFFPLLSRLVVVVGEDDVAGLVLLCSGVVVAVATVADVLLDVLLDALVAFFDRASGEDGDEEPSAL